MRIVCIIHSLDGGGAERVMASLASRLAARQHAVTLVTLDDGTNERHVVDPAVARRRLDLMRASHGVVEKLLLTRLRTKRLRDAIADASPEVVLSFCDRTNILTLMAAGSLGVPVVVSERSDPSQQRLGGAWEFLRGRTYRRATAIVALTEASALHLRQRFAVPVRVIPSAVDVPPFVSDRAVASNARRIIGIGRLETEKGFDRLIEAFASVAERAPDWSLRILGEGSMRSRLQEQIGDLALTSKVAMPGWVRPVWDELAASTVFALPSRYEGFPSALLEAMAMGVPSVAVDCESGPRVIIDNESRGLLVPNGVAELANGLARLVEDADLRERIGRGGQDVIARFGWDALVDAYEEILTSAANA